MHTVLVHLTAPQARAALALSVKGPATLTKATEADVWSTHRALVEKGLAIETALPNDAARFSLDRSLAN